jgi:predicted flap endonuclease-1-like 5' DNA nuclease
MWSIITTIWLCLLVAAILGFILGWLLSKLFGGSASVDTSASDAEIAGYKRKISTLEADLKTCQDSRASMEGELKDWSAKASTLSSAGAVGGGNLADLQAENDALRAELAEIEQEKLYLLGQVKKAEVGESIRREVPMEERDDLELINGVGPVLERMLYDMGIYFFKDIARWDAAKIAEINEKLPQFKGRIEREGWVESAKEEHYKKYGERL